MVAESFTCPQCGATSHHPDDVRYGYCAKCHAFTGDYMPMSIAERALAGRIKAMGAAGLRWAGLTSIDVMSGTAEGIGDQGEQTFRGFVTVECKAEDGSIMAGQLDPKMCREMALQFVEAAEAADQDAMVFRVMTRDVGSPATAVAQFVLALRKERDLDR